MFLKGSGFLLDHKYFTGWHLHPKDLYFTLLFNCLYVVLVVCNLSSYIRTLSVRRLLLSTPTTELYFDSPCNVQCESSVPVESAALEVVSFFSKMREGSRFDYQYGPGLWTTATITGTPSTPSSLPPD